MNIGQKIQRLRKERHLTQQQVADASHITVSHISKIERGTKMPRIPSLQKIASSLGVTLSHLLEEERVAHEKSIKRRSKNVEANKCP